jgi:hypothetical protein
MAPIGLAIFFTFMTITEGGGQKALKRKFIEVLPLLIFLIIGIHSCIEGKLLYLASGSDYQFQFYAIALTDSVCQYSRSFLVPLILISLTQEYVFEFRELECRHADRALALFG